ncbi:acyl-CoA N-acyltransferase [Cristinia sonorae]|uniref:N-alpha-acetyltransferase 40 n=1 Tax=Cristinia sonorae TaxID=1940300 RepID=A0A8K0USQ5_9AGAR|nr:acyl-CoA N-acyltransferase [Cristinia sonorae]
MPRPLSDRIRAARAATVEQLTESIVLTVTLDSKLFHFNVAFASDISKDEREIVWRLLNGNMRDMSKNSSLGWLPIKKKKELFHSQSRFIIVRDDAADIVAFTMFRFDVEDDGDVLYCYEVQVAGESRGFGLGKQLMDFLASIGKKWRMECLMLTVLKVNKGAIRFYKSYGLQVDEYSPDDPDCDYEILSLPFSETDSGS